MSKNINASLKTVYYESINRGTKRVEYREMSQYWIERLVDMSKYPGKTWEEVRDILRKGGTLHAQKYDTITFFNNGRHMTMKVEGIDIRDHHTSFGIRLGKRVNEPINFFE